MVTKSKVGRFFHKELIKGKEAERKEGWMINFKKRLNRNRKLRMKSFSHPGYEGTCYNGKQTAIDEILDPGAAASHAGVFRGTNSMGG